MFYQFRLTNSKQWKHKTGKIMKTALIVLTVCKITGFGVWIKAEY